MSDKPSPDGYDDLEALLANDIPLDPDEAAGRTTELASPTGDAAPHGDLGPVPAQDDPEPTPDEASTGADEPPVPPARDPYPTPAPSPLEAYVGALADEVGSSADGEEVYVDPETLLSLAQACLAEARAEREQRRLADEAVRRQLADGIRAVPPVVTVNPTIEIASVDAGNATLHAESLSLPPSPYAALAGPREAPAKAPTTTDSAPDSLLEPAPEPTDAQKAPDEPKAPAKARKGIPATVVGIAIGLALLAVLLLVLQAVSGGAVGAVASL